MHRLLAIAVLISISHAQTAPNHTGSICGNVQDETGAPAKGVWITPYWVGAHSGGMLGSRTDQDGHYCVSHLELGTYYVAATDEERGYAGYFLLYFAEPKPAQYAKIDVDRPAATVDFRIPYKAAFLHVRFRDSTTGQHIAPPFMTVSLSARSDPEHRSLRDSSASNKTILIPPDEDVLLCVDVEGYNTWPSDGSQGQMLSFSPGSSHTLEVSLVARPTADH